MKRFIFYFLISALSVIATRQGFSQNKKISEMTSATSISGSEYFPIVQSGANKKLTFSSLGFGSLTAGRIPYASTAYTIVNGPYWNIANSNLGLGADPSTAARLVVTEDGTNPGIKIQYGGANTWASILGPDNRDFRFVLNDNDVTDKFAFFTSNGGASASRFEVMRDGKLKILTAPTNDDTETSFLVRQSDGEIQTRAYSSLGTSGTYNVTFSSVSNLDATPTNSAGTSKYTRVGDIVTVTMYANCDPTTTGLYTFRATIPVSSNFTVVTDLLGLGTSSVNDGCAITGDVANDIAEVTCSSSSTGIRAVYLTFTYKVQ